MGTALCASGHGRLKRKPVSEYYLGAQIGLGMINEPRKAPSAVNVAAPMASRSRTDS